MQWNSTDGGETFQVWFSQILSSLCGQRFAKFSIFCLLVPLQIRVGWDSFWQYFTNLCGGYLVFTFNHYQTVDLLLNLLFACQELEILEEAAFRYLLCTTLSFGLKIKQSVWPLHSKFFDISKYCCHFIILSPGDENESLLASALKIRTTIYMHILGTVSRKK